MLGPVFHDADQTLPQTLIAQLHLPEFLLGPLLCAQPLLYGQRTQPGRGLRTHPHYERSSSAANICSNGICHPLGEVRSSWNTRQVSDLPRALSVNCLL